jgi:hypothetical protein
MNKYILFSIIIFCLCLNSCTSDDLQQKQIKKQLQYDNDANFTAIDTTEGDPVKPNKKD